MLMRFQCDNLGNLAINTSGLGFLSWTFAAKLRTQQNHRSSARQKPRWCDTNPPLQQKVGPKLPENRHHYSRHPRWLQPMRWNAMKAELSASAWTCLDCLLPTSINTGLPWNQETPSLVLAANAPPVAQSWATSWHEFEMSEMSFETRPVHLCNMTGDDLCSWILFDKRVWNIAKSSSWWATSAESPPHGPSPQVSTLHCDQSILVTNPRLIQLLFSTYGCLRWIIFKNI